jgi:hypothetical protein
VNQEQLSKKLKKDNGRKMVIAIAGHADSAVTFIDLVHTLGVEHELDDLVSSSPERQQRVRDVRRELKLPAVAELDDEEDEQLDG